LLPECYFLYFMFLAILTSFDGRLPRLDSLYIGRCFVEENDVYNNHQASVWVPKIKSNTTCNKFNIIFRLCKL
jgi:hypothetical protein